MNKLIGLLRKFLNLRGHLIEDLIIAIEITKIMKLMNSDDLNELSSMTYEEAVNRLNASQ